MTEPLSAGIDRLYRRAVTDPASIDDPALAEWAESVAELVAGSREAARGTRRAIRTARKLARYWSSRDSGELSDWRHGVDEALGALGWRAQLEVAMAGLHRSPSPERFEAVRDRHRQVHFTEWMEGVSYEEWLEER